MAAEAIIRNDERFGRCRRRAKRLPRQRILRERGRQNPLGHRTERQRPGVRLSSAAFLREGSVREFVTIRMSLGILSFTIGLNFQKVKCLFLSKTGARFPFTWPIRHDQFCANGFGSENLPIIGDAHGYLRFRRGRIHFNE